MTADPRPRGTVRRGGTSPSVLVFDVNETLVDVEATHVLFEETFGDRRVMREWLGQLFMYSMALTLAGLYKDLSALGEGCFRMVGAVHGIAVTDEAAEALSRAMKTLPAHGDAEEGLRLLKEAGFRMVTLTNSPPTPGHASPLENAGLARFFERQFTVETCRAYKPDRAVYHMVAQELDVPPGECCMVACHVWDTMGAQAAGMAGALVTRTGNACLPIPGLPQPDLVGHDLPELARGMIRAWR